MTRSRYIPEREPDKKHQNRQVPTLFMKYSVKTYYGIKRNTTALRAVRSSLIFCSEALTAIPDIAPSEFFLIKENLVLVDIIFQVMKISIQTVIYDGSLTI